MTTENTTLETAILKDHHFRRLRADCLRLENGEDQGKYVNSGEESDCQNTAPLRPQSVLITSTDGPEIETTDEKDSLRNRKKGNLQPKQCVYVVEPINLLQS